jgi:hypothetical protein
MFQKIKQRINDVRTVAALCNAAEQHALARGEEAPGAEHFVMAALRLPEGSARRALQRVGGTPEGFDAAVLAQYREALQGVGVAAEVAGLGADADCVPAKGGLYRAKPSGQALIEAMVRRPNAPPPLRGAHVLSAVGSVPRGVLARSLRQMGIEPEALVKAALDELGVAAAAPPQR